MINEECFEALLDMFSRDTGGVDMTHDTTRREVVKFLKKEERKPENEWSIFPRFLDKQIRERFLSDSALEEGYGCGDVYDFLKWFEYSKEELQES